MSAATALALGTQYSSGVPAYVPQSQRGLAVSASITPTQIMDITTITSTTPGSYASPATITTPGNYLMTANNVYDVDVAFVFLKTGGTLGTTPDQLFFSISPNTNASDNEFGYNVYEQAWNFAVPPGDALAGNFIPGHIRARLSTPVTSGVTYGNLALYCAAVAGTGSTATWTVGVKSCSVTWVGAI